MDYALPICYALLLWWFSTGTIFFLDQLPRRTFKWSMGGATLLLGIALLAVWDSADRTDQYAVYCGFSGGLLAWGWQEMSLYMGYITGPRKHACRAGCSGWKHFGHAIAVNLWHEIAIVVMAVLIAVISWDGANQWALWTYLLLWAMHLSARLNVFLGVRNVSAEFVPEHMAVLRSFLTKKPMNLLFPVSVTGGTIAAALLLDSSFSALTNGDRTGFALLGALASLAVLEHWMLVLPLPVERLFRWTLSLSRASKMRKAVPPSFDYTTPKFNPTP